MNRRMVYALLAAAVLLIGIGSGVAGEMQFHNCGLCKSMMEEPGLMQHMKWETHPIATGMIAVTTVDSGFEKAYESAHANMMAAMKRLEAGEQMELCPICQSMNKLAQAGAKFENIDSTGGHILAVTSDNPEVVAQIHEHARMAGEMMASHDEEHAHGG